MTSNATEEGDDCKVFISRIPQHFDEVSVKRLLEEKLNQADAVSYVALGKEKDENGHDAQPPPRGKKNTETPEHRGFAFCTLASPELQQAALELGTIRGGAKLTSTKKHTLYMKPVVRQTDGEGGEAEASDKNVCFLWSKSRCPYGEKCKFVHQGEGGCLVKNDPGSAVEAKKKIKCFDHRKGRCKKGDACPYSHDFEATLKEKKASQPRPNAEKDCINWKSKGKCRKGEACPYRHCEAIREAFLAKKNKRKQADDGTTKQVNVKTQQPLGIRVFGLNYETTEANVRELFKDCGTIVEVTFPTFEDSGRCKGYCGILFQSPKATDKAVALDGTELHGRWLRVQAGKMYLKQWEAHHERRQGLLDDEYEKEPIQEAQEELVGEFGQKVKRRKKHGY